MNHHDNVTYVPLATERTKRVIEHMQPGVIEVIDVVNAADSNDRKEVDAWIAITDDVSHFVYNEGGRDPDMNLGLTEAVRTSVAESTIKE